MTDKQLAAFKTWAGLWERTGVVTDAENLAKLAPLILDRLKKAEQERDEAIRQGDERLADLWDAKQAEIKNLRSEIDQLRCDLDAATAEADKYKMGLSISVNVESAMADQIAAAKAEIARLRAEVKP